MEKSIWASPISLIIVTIITAKTFYTEVKINQSASPHVNGHTDAVCGLPATSTIGTIYRYTYINYPIFVSFTKVIPYIKVLDINYSLVNIFIVKCVHHIKNKFTLSLV